MGSSCVHQRFGTGFPRIAAAHCRARFVVHVHRTKKTPHGFQGIAPSRGPCARGNPAISGTRGPAQANPEDRRHRQPGHQPQAPPLPGGRSRATPKGKRVETRKTMTPGQILIVSDDSEFVRSLVARWRMEKDPPAITAVSTGVSRQASSSGYELIVVGPLRDCSALPEGPTLDPDSVVCAVGDDESLKLVRAVR